MKANGVGEDVCCECECDGGVCLAGEAIELATTGVVNAGDGTTVVGALDAVLLATWFPDCGWLEEAADEFPPLVVVDVVVEEAAEDEAALVSG